MLRNLLAALLALAMLWSGTSAWGQSYPSRPVRVIVPFGPSLPDTISRILGAQLAVQMGQPFVVENRPGANGIPGAEAVAKAAPDGYTLLLHSTSIALSPSMYKKLPYDTIRDLAPITLVGDVGAMVVVVSPSVPARSIQELIAYARRPDVKLSYGSSGVGNVIHLAGELFKARAGIDMLHVPYKGSGQWVTALMSGEIQVAVAPAGTLLQQVKSGHIRALAYAHSTRAAALPDVPTTAEAGLSNMEIEGGWFAMFAPGKTPAEIVTRLHAEIQKAVNDPQTRTRFTGAQTNPIASSPADFTRYLNDQISKYAEMFKLAGLQPE